ncbi:putative glycosyl transferase CAP10 domain-containing protein [Helianthus anomalus]
MHGSVSLNYILSCGCVPLIINPKYDDFFSRGLFPKNITYRSLPKTYVHPLKLQSSGETHIQPK